MTEKPPRKADRARWRGEIVRHLGDLPRQFLALEAAMSAFGGDFDLREFKSAFETTDDMEAYNRVQAVERALGRVQNYVGELADAGVKLAELARPPMDARGSRYERAFTALRDAGVIDRGLSRRLVRAQHARTRIEHGYVETPAGDVHAAAILVHDVAGDFIDRYRDWVARYLQAAS